MMNGFFAWAAKWRTRRRADRDAQAHEPAFFGGCTRTDTVVFVHGLIGHYKTTWGRFPELLLSDPNIPRVDLWLWGYRSSLLATDKAIETEAERLMSDVRVHLQDPQHVFFVGHSMGGLAILSGLVQELIGNRALDVPARVSRHIILYATPVLGSQVASILRFTIGNVPIWKRLLSVQIRNLAPDTFVNTLLRQVTNRIYSPTITPAEESSKRKIPITACVGLRDRMVSEASAKGVFDQPPPVMLDEDHTSIKEPNSREDRRYGPVRRILIAHYRAWFYEMAQSCLGAPNRKRAAKILFERCEHALEFRLKKVVRFDYDRKDAQEQHRLKLQLLDIAIDHTRDTPGVDFGKLLDFALEDL